MTPKFFVGRSLLLSLLLGGAVLPAHQAFALTAKECHAMFKEARTAGTLNGQLYRDFKVSECGITSKSRAKPNTEKNTRANTQANTRSRSATKTSKTPAEKNAAEMAQTPSPSQGAKMPATAPIRSGAVVFPSSVSPRYANLKPGKARFRTCLDQYNANKANNGNGTLRWIQRGGGYYSECNAKLK